MSELRIGILQTGQAPWSLRTTHGDYDMMCRNLIGAEPATSPTYRVLHAEFPDDPCSCDAWIVTGSRHGVNDGFEWIARLEDFLRDAFAAERRIVGICFGHQILARALGGEVRKHPDGPGIGVMDYTFSEPDSAAATLSLNAWHYDQVFVPPDGAEVIARSDFCLYAGLGYGARAISFQTHPEFTTAYMAGLIAHYRGSDLSPAEAESAMNSLERPVQSDVVAARIRSFLAT